MCLIWGGGTNKKLLLTIVGLYQIDACATVPGHKADWPNKVQTHVQVMGVIYFRMQVQCIRLPEETAHKRRDQTNQRIENATKEKSSVVQITTSVSSSVKLTGLIQWNITAPHVPPFLLKGTLIQWRHLTTKTNWNMSRIYVQKMI